MRNQVLVGDAREQLANLPDESVQCCVTSPPYFGLRDYGMHGQLGLESTPEEYVTKLVDVLRDVRRTLRPDGTLWLNLGDSYANDSKWGGHTSGKHAVGVHDTSVGRGRRNTGLKSKDLIGIPWMVAFALRADGWYLRSDIIWAKGNCMPESVKDRPTKSHEYVFLLTKSQDYFYDQDAIREPASVNKPWASTSNGGNKYIGVRNDGGASKSLGKSANDLRNRRSIWIINPKPYKEAHFAVMPEELAQLCIKAGTSERGCCSSCGAPWDRTFETTPRQSREGIKNGIAPENGAAGTRERAPAGSGGGNVLASVGKIPTGWTAGCACQAEVHPCLVLDPFSGAGTTAVTAVKLGRAYLGIELNPSYVELSLKRLAPVLEARSQQDVVEGLWDE